MYFKRVQGGFTVMKWGAVSFKKALNLVKVEGTLESEYYYTILNKSIFLTARDLYGDN